MGTCTRMCVCVCVCVCVRACVRVCCGRTFDRSGDLTRHKKYCNDQPPPPKQSEFHCGCGRLFHRKGISQGTSITTPAKVVSLVQFFRSRTLLLSSVRPLKIKVCASGCASVRVQVAVRVFACMCVRACACVHVRACVCVRAYV